MGLRPEGFGCCWWQPSACNPYVIIDDYEPMVAVYTHPDDYPLRDKAMKLYRIAQVFEVVRLPKFRLRFTVPKVMKSSSYHIAPVSC